MAMAGSRDGGEMNFHWLTVRSVTTMFLALFCAAVWMGSSSHLILAAPLPPSELSITDVANDAGTALQVSWTPSPDDTAEAQPRQVIGYRLERTAADVQRPGLYQKWVRWWRPAAAPAADENQPKVLGVIPAGVLTFDDTTCLPDQEYVYILTALGPEDAASEPIRSERAQPVVSWFNRDKGFLCAVSIFLCGGLIVSTELARRGKPIYIRPIAGLQAIEEAVGRSTEMGRPILFVPGIVDMNEIQTVAGVTVMSHVAQTAAQYDMALDVPTARSLVMTAARDAVQAGCLLADRPDVFNPSRIYYVTDDQFSYVAHVCGHMLRDKPAACFYIGQFYAESLLLAETGNSIGAIQIAGTAEASQLPFFVAACDYALLGEEMFAASAYLSREPEQLGMLRGQDYAKLLAGALILGGCLFLTQVSVVHQLFERFFAG